MLDDLAHFFDGFAAGLAAQLLEEGETRAVDVHRGGEDIVLDHAVELVEDDLAAPGLDRRDRQPTDGGSALAHGVAHDVGIDAVAREGEDAAVDGGAHQLGVIAQVVVLRAVMHIHGAQRGDEDRRGEAAAEKLEGHVGLDVLAERVHIHEDLLPFVIVARGGRAGELAARSGHIVAAGLAVAHGAGHAVRGGVLSRCFQDLFVFHYALLRKVFEMGIFRITTQLSAI